MKKKLGKYSNYKESGFEWLGKIPVHWRITPNRELFTEIIDRNQLVESLLSVTISRGVMLQNDLIRNSSKKDSSNEDKSKYKLVQPGYIVYNKMRAWQGAIGLSNYRGIVSPAYIVVKPRNNNIAKYYHYLFRTLAFMKEAERWSYGITSDQWSLRPQHFKMIYCSVPPPEEQTAIVRFLDYIDNRIKKYIRTKKKMIELLNEQKQAIIQHAVTRGLDPNVRFKPSGVEWLGEIPEHWEVLRLKTFSKMKSGDNITSFGIDEKGEYPVYGGNGLRGYTSDYTHEGDFVLIGRQGALCGNVHYASGKFWASEHAVVASSPKIYNTYWFGELLRTMNLNQYSIAAAQPGLAVDRILNLWVPVPPPDEQNNICNYIKSETKSINKIILRTEQEIKLILEYKNRLIADVVTGKLDVRDAAKYLPKELEEIETVDDVIDEINSNEEIMEVDENAEN